MSQDIDKIAAPALPVSTQSNPTFNIFRLFFNRLVAVINALIDRNVMYRDESSTTYTLTLQDADSVLRFTGASPAVTIPTEAAVDYPLNTEISIRQAGTGALTLTTTSLTINGTVPSWAQHVEVKFRKVAANTWDVV